MVKRLADLSDTLDEVQTTMRSAKTRLRNAAILCNLTELHPVIDNMTRWVSKAYMLSLFIRMSPELIEAIEYKEDAE